MSFLKPSTDIYIKGPNHYVPEKVINNDYLVEWMGASIRGTWIEKRTGIQERRWVDEDTAVSDLATICASNFLDTFKIDKTKISTMIMSTISGDYPTPPTAPLVQHRLELEDIGCFDLGAACGGFITSLLTASSICMATQSDILLVSAEIRSKFIAKDNFETNVLFGDGSATCLVTLEKENADFKIIGIKCYSDGSVADIISIPDGGSRSPIIPGKEYKNTLVMKGGAELFIKALNGMHKTSLDLLENLDLSLSDIDWVVPHQANLLMIKALAKKLDFPMEKVMQTVKFWGNTSGSSVGMALSYLKENYPIKKGDKVLMISAGGGGLAANGIIEVL